jgi:hypothetical protein
MRKLSLHSARALVIALALVGYALPPTGLTQNSAGNTPLTRPAQQLQAESGPSAGSPALRADSRPIKVDVSLVLVSVSAVDRNMRIQWVLSMEVFCAMSPMRRWE